MRPQAARRKLNLKSTPTSNFADEEVNPIIVEVEDGGAAAAVCVHNDDGNDVGPLDGSPTKNISPPMGGLRPAMLSN